jgi:hypothetical protein
MSLLQRKFSLAQKGAAALVVDFDLADYDQTFQTFDDPAQIGLILDFNTGEVRQSDALGPGFQIGTFYTGAGFVAADFDYMWDQQGAFAPNLAFSPVNTWILGTGGGSGPEWQYEVSNPPPGPPEIPDGILRIRNAGDMVEVTQANNTMEVINGP